MASAADKLKKTSNGGIPAVATVQSSRTTGVTSLSVDTQQFWPTATGVSFSTYKVDTNNNKIAGSQTDWSAVSNGSNTLSGLVRTGGAADTGNAIGDKVQMGPTADWAEQVIEAVLVQHNPDGTHAVMTGTSLTLSGALAAAAISGTTGTFSGAVTATGKITAGGGIQNTAASTASGSTITPTTQFYTVTALAANATIAVPSLTPWDGMPFVQRIKDNGTSRTLAYAAGYTNISGLATPTATVSSKWLTVAGAYEASSSKYQIMSIINEA